MPYDVILESVTPGFRNPVVAVVRTLLGYDLPTCVSTVESAPVTILFGVSLEDAEKARLMLEEGYFPAGKNWPRPDPGQLCCGIKIVEIS